MMRSLYSAVTGLRSHQTKMDVIGNNIANVNTVGFKSSRVVFSDVFSQTIKTAMAPQRNNGGSNPMQIGLGALVAAIDTKHTSAPSQYTSNPLDLALEGEGYFVIRTGIGDRDYVYQRAGNFDLSPNGYLINSSGQYVQCFNSVYVDGTQGSADVAGWVNKSNADFESFSFDATDPSILTTPAGTYIFQVDAAGGLVVQKNGGVMQPQPNYTLTYADGSALASPPDLLAGESLTLSVEGLGDFTFVAKADKSYAAQGDILLDMKSSLTMASITVKNNDDFTPGNVMGDMYIDRDLYYDVAIDEGGAVKAVMIADTLLPNGYYATEGETVTLGYVALGTFTNPSGLEKVGNNQYRESASTGRVTFTTANTDGAARIKPGALEMSNVDLATEFTEMITTQRGFQANSRTITTSDSMLEEIVNLKR